LLKALDAFMAGVGAGAPIDLDAEAEALTMLVG